MQIGHVYIFSEGTLDVDGALDASTYIMYENLMKIAEVKKGGDVSKLHDNMNNLFYNVTNGKQILEFVLPVARNINCFAISGCNFKTSGAVFTFRIYTNGRYETVRTYSSDVDGKPVMICFNRVPVTKIKIEIYATNNLQIGELAFGEALKMPISPSVGYRPALFNVDDEITFLKSENNSVGRSTVNKRAAIENLSFKLINHNWVRSTWVPFLKKAVGVPIWGGSWIGPVS